MWTKKPLVWFILRREPYYHKIQYSKAPKFDTAAAVFGVVVGAFVVYLTLATFGSGGADLTDLTCVVWYLFLIFYSMKVVLFLLKTDTGCMMFNPIVFLSFILVAVRSLIPPYNSRV